MFTIFCPTIQATGTKFLLAFFKAVTGKDSLSLPIFLSHRSKEKVTNVVHIHVVHDTPYLDRIKQLCEEAHVVIPIRDPLASVVRADSISRPFGASCAKSFLTLRDIGETHNATYVPVDLLSRQTFNKRLAALSNALPPIYKGRKDNICMDWACRWPVHNARIYDLKELYINKDVSKLSKLQGWEELIENRPILKPWLEHMGYRNLLWWK